MQPCREREREHCPQVATQFQVVMKFSSTDVMSSLSKYGSQSGLCGQGRGSKTQFSCGRRKWMTLRLIQLAEIPKRYMTFYFKNLGPLDFVHPCYVVVMPLVVK